MASISDSSVSSVSSKPWFLTYIEEFNEVFLWKNGSRMKLKDGSSSGPVTDVSVLDVLANTVTVSFIYMV